MIEAHELTKRYGDKTAVHTLSFTIAPGTVTGFLGPNGAGKSTTMRLIMGLDRPTSGTVTVNGKPYGQHRSPLREVGALLDARAVHPGRSARSHLRAMAATHNIKTSRVSEVIEMTGLAGAATKRVGGFSLGMSQRLGIAAALLGDPRTLILDEPVNGLDPEGVQSRWGRDGRECRTEHCCRHPDHGPPRWCSAAAPGRAATPPTCGAGFRWVCRSGTATPERHRRLCARALSRS
jgi:ABC-2 type transport system ATP-binding protein